MMADVSETQKPPLGPAQTQPSSLPQPQQPAQPPQQLAQLTQKTQQLTQQPPQATQQPKQSQQVPESSGQPLVTPVTTNLSNIPPITVPVTTTPMATSITLPITVPITAPITMPITAPITVPITAHQQSATTIVQPTLTTRPPSTLSVVPITTTPVVKNEPNKYICCLLDNGARCDRVAGNASFSARIQKIVGTKKMNFALDPTVRHAYICEHHKAIITVAKKSTTLARDTKSNARNYTTNNNNNNTNTLAPQPDMNYNDFTVRQQPLQPQHPVNLVLLNNQNRLANNHTGGMNNLPIRQGNQIPYGHYQGGHKNQVGFENTGGDSLPSSSSGVDVDLQQLQVNTLRRYKRHFRVQTRPGLNKMQLAESLKSHFRTLPIIEKEAITYFVYIVKCYRNKLDHNPKAD